MLADYFINLCLVDWGRKNLFSRVPGDGCPGHTTSPGQVGVCPMFLAGRSCRLCALERELTPSDQLTACRRLFAFLCRFFLSVELFSKQAGAVFSGYHLGAEL